MTLYRITLTDPPGRRPQVRCFVVAAESSEYAIRKLHESCAWAFIDNPQIEIENSLEDIIEVYCYRQR